jgi:hypothetical protein
MIKRNERHFYPCISTREKMWREKSHDLSEVTILLENNFNISKKVCNSYINKIKKDYFDSYFYDGYNQSQVDYSIDANGILYIRDRLLEPGTEVVIVSCGYKETLNYNGLIGTYNNELVDTTSFGNGIYLFSSYIEDIIW